MRDQLIRDWERFRDAPSPDPIGHIRDVYRIDPGARYLGVPLPHPIGKASGQLSLRRDQLDADAAAGLALVVLKTVIAQDASGHQSMAAWAIHETRMKVERHAAADGREGWTVTWKGRGWDRSFEEYLELVRSARELTQAGGPLIVPSVKYHLPPAGEPFNEGEYQFTTSQLAKAWGSGPLLVEKDFSPTLAGDSRSDQRRQILRWLQEAPGLIRRGAGDDCRVALKLMNATFDDEFQLAMLAAGSDADALVTFNRLWDAERGVAVGGWELSDRNLRALHAAQSAAMELPPLVGTGNVNSGRMIMAYALAGCASVQLHTWFQLPLGEYGIRAGARPVRALQTLLFDPHDGLVATMLELEEAGFLARHNGELRFLDAVGLAARRPDAPRLG